MLALVAGPFVPASAETDRLASEGASDPPRDVVLVSIDSVRADHLPFYGYPRDTVPNLSRLARERGALVFRRASAVAPACHPAHTSLVTGLYPHQVGVAWCGEDVVATHRELEDPEWESELDELQAQLAAQPPPLRQRKISAIMNWLRIPEETETLAQHLQERGWRTGGFVSIWTIQGRFGYARGFDRYGDEMPEYYGPGRLSWLLRDTIGSQRRQIGETTADQALDFLEELEPEDPFFLFLHLGDTHVPYDGRDVEGFRESDEERQALQELWRARYPSESVERAMAVMDGGALLDEYDRSLRYADAQLGRVLEALAALGRLERTLVVVTSDHGESFGQHRYLSKAQRKRLFFEHSVYVWEETQHVPLLILDPEVRRLEVREENVSQVDVVPTILGRLGLSVAEFAAGELPGRDLMGPGAGDPRRVLFMSFGRGRPGLLREVFLDYPRFIGYREGDRKFFVDRDRFRNPRKGRCFLYDLAADPHEMDNLCPSAPPEDTARHRRVLVDWYASAVELRRKSP